MRSLSPPPRPPCDEVDLVSPDKSGAGDGTRAQPISFRSPLAVEPPTSLSSSSSSPGRVTNKRRKLDLADGGGGGSDGGGGGGGSGVGGGGVGTTPLLPLLPPYAKWEVTQKGLELVLAAANEDERASQEEVVFQHLRDSRTFEGPFVYECREPLSDGSFNPFAALVVYIRLRILDADKRSVDKKY